jgi:hypothetical protein
LAYQISVFLVCLSLPLAIVRSSALRQQRPATILLVTVRSENIKCESDLIADLAEQGALPQDVVEERRHAIWILCRATTSSTRCGAIRLLPFKWKFVTAARHRSKQFAPPSDLATPLGRALAPVGPL